jgi:hypothetical protein
MSTSKSVVAQIDTVRGQDAGDRETHGVTGLYPGP